MHPKTQEYTTWPGQQNYHPPGWFVLVLTFKVLSSTYWLWYIREFPGWENGSSAWNPPCFPEKLSKCACAGWIAAGQKKDHSVHCSLVDVLLGNAYRNNLIYGHITDLPIILGSPLIPQQSPRRKVNSYIDYRTLSWSSMGILSHSFLQLWNRWEEFRFTLNMTFNVPITSLASERVMSGKTTFVSRL